MACSVICENFAFPVHKWLKTHHCACSRPQIIVFGSHRIAGINLRYFSSWCVTDERFPLETQSSFSYLLSSFLSFSKKKYKDHLSFLVCRFRLTKHLLHTQGYASIFSSSSSQIHSMWKIWEKSRVIGTNWVIGPLTNHSNGSRRFVFPR